MSNEQKTRNFAWGVGLSVVLMVVMYTGLIYYADWWTFIAETRLLDLAISAGLIKYHDHNAGFIDGVRDLKHYYMSQEPISWDLLGVVILIFLTFYALKSVQFAAISRLFGAKTKAGTNIRSFSYGALVGRFTPFGVGDTAIATAMQAEGVPLANAKAAVFTERLFVLFEILVFAIIGLFTIGWDGWFAQVICAVGIVAVAGLVKYGRDPAVVSDFLAQTKKSLSVLAAKPLASTWTALLSLMAFGLEDIAAYFTAMAFTTSVVVLKVDFSVLLMGVVASYLARLIRITPGGLGQFEWGFALALYFGGLGFPECVAIAVLDNFFRYVSGTIFHFLATRSGSVKVTLGDVLTAFKRGEGDSEPADVSGASADAVPAPLPEVALKRAPSASKVWGRMAAVAAVGLAIFYIDEFTLLMFDYWLLDSLGYGSVFSTNLTAGIWLFILGLVPMAAGIIFPAFANKLPDHQKKFVIAVGLMIGSMGGYITAMEYQNFLLAFSGSGFGASDPIFGKDVGFYIAVLPAIWNVLEVLMLGMTMGVIASIGCGYAAHLNSAEVDKDSTAGLSRFAHLLGAISKPGNLVPLVVLGALLGISEYYTKYDLLYIFNHEAAIETGASAIDVTGIFSNLHYIYVTTLVIFGLTGLLYMYLKTLNQVVEGKAPADWREKINGFAKYAVWLVVFDFGFKGVISVRDWLLIKPNEPVVQLEFIQHHLDATRKAYGIDKIEEIEFRPKGPDAPLPDVEKLVNHPTIKNAPLWPGFTSYLERFIDPQHEMRILQQKGDKMIYGPTLEIFKQQQKLRTYYDFLGIDSVRYTIDGEKKMYVSAVRELPLMEPVPWLAWFGQRFVMFTHGHGVVMAPAAEYDSEGEPEFLLNNIPIENTPPGLEIENPRIYFGEGSSTMAYSNIDQMKELDHPTDQGRAEMTLGDQMEGTVAIDSALKRFVFGWRSDQFFEVMFSSLIKDNTRVHFFRTPGERMGRVAPFLYFDTNPYAVIADGKVVWLTNAMTNSDMYPYSTFEYLGDKSDERAFEKHIQAPIVKTNYVEDSVKVTVDAFDGKLKFYKIADAPLINAWAKVYPDLFVDGKEMPSSVRAHLTYPVHLFHIQFDDVYIYYHMNDPFYYFNMEDMWDDGDEVLGAILDRGKAIRFSIEPGNFILETGVNGIPASSEKYQFASHLVFTPEKALNLRAIPLVYQDGEDYGKVFVLTVPKGYYYPGPEQADSTIDQNPKISEQISWWNRMGTDVIRGHTSTLVVDGEVIYVEPIFIRSQQNPVTQLRRVVVVFRGMARMGETLEEALRKAVADYAEIHETAMLTPEATGGEETVQ